MAKQLIMPPRGPLAGRGNGTGFDGNRPTGEDVWQGYGVRWTNTGLEITAPTSRQSYGPLLLGGAVGLIAMLLLIVNLPDARHGESLASPATWLVSALIGFVVMAAVAGPFYLWPGKWLRDTALETLEIRPDGITVNRDRFFPRDWIHRIGIEPLKDDQSDFPYAVIGIIGTRQMTLLAGFDAPTAEVVGTAIEQARRQLWQETR